MQVSGLLHALVTLSPVKEPPSTHRIRGWAGPRAGLDAEVKRKNPFLPLPVIKPRSSSIKFKT